MPMILKWWRVKFTHHIGEVLVEGEVRMIPGYDKLDALVKMNRFYKSKLARGSNELPHIVSCVEETEGRASSILTI